MLSACLVPRDAGGVGCGVGEIGACCEVLGAALRCDETDFSRHTTYRLQAVIRHALSQPYCAKYLLGVGGQQYLVASATSEVGIGEGNCVRAACAVQQAYQRPLHSREGLPYNLRTALRPMIFSSRHVK